MFSKLFPSFVVLGFCLAATTCYAPDIIEIVNPFESFFNRVEYGFPFGNTNINQAACDFEFRCNNGTCKCPHSQASSYTAGNSPPCKIKAGKRCINKFYYYSGRAGFQTITNELVCVDNVECLPPGLYSCLPVFHMEDDGTCVRQGDIGETCNSDVDCNTEKYLAREEINGRKICICVDGTCECKSGYMESRTVFCQKGFSNFNETCEADDDCHSDDNGFALICNSNGRCYCSGSKPVFSKREGYKRGGVCVQAFGGKCYSDEDCHKNFEYNRRSGRCLCKDLYSVNYDGNCKRNL